MDQSVSTPPSRSINNPSLYMGMPRRLLPKQQKRQPDDLHDGLVLPQHRHLDAPRAPISAIHSRRADTAISRPMMTMATMTRNQRGSLADDQYQCRGDDQFVGDGIQEGAQARGLAQLARVIAVQAVGDAGQREGGARRRVTSTDRAAQVEQRE
jgi:hypothetical protein